MKKKVSIIITTRNEEKNIKNCLESIRYQTYPSILIEIIVVDNNSSDKTKEIAQKYTKKVFNFGPERSAQRNYGVKKAKGKYILYLDADMILSSTVIEKAVNRLNNCDLTALYIPEIILGNSYWSRVRSFERSFYDGTVIDCVRFVKKDVFEKVGGFDETMTGPEDWDFDKKIRKIGKVGMLDKYDFNEVANKLIYLSASDEYKYPINKLCCLLKCAVLYHNEAKFDLKKYLIKKSYYAKSFDIYINKWGRKDPDIIKQFGILYRYLLVFTENGKWKKLISHFNLVIGLYSMKVLVGFIYILK